MWLCQRRTIIHTESEEQTSGSLLPKLEREREREKTKLLPITPLTYRPHSQKKGEREGKGEKMSPESSRLPMTVSDGFQN